MRLSRGSGTWRIVDARTGRVVAGDRRTGYGLTLADVERGATMTPASSD